MTIYTIQGCRWLEPIQADIEQKEESKIHWVMKRQLEKTHYGGPPSQSWVKEERLLTKRGHFGSSEMLC